MLKRLRLALLAVLVLVGGVYVAVHRAKTVSPEIDFSAQVPPGADQVVLVEAAGKQSTTAQVWVMERTSKNTWTRVHGPYTAHTGRSGFRLPAERHEGDGTTPIGAFALSAAFGQGNRPGGSLPYTVVTPGQCWVSSSDRDDYNRWIPGGLCGTTDVDLFEKSKPNAIFHTAMVMDFNIGDRVKDRGSAIFFHCNVTEKGQVLATYGGISLAEGDLRTIISSIDVSKNPVAVIGPDSTFAAKPA